MSSYPTKDIAAAVIDGRSFVREGRRLAGQIALSRMARLAELLLDTNGELQVELLGEQSNQGNFLVLSVSGELLLSCQRCLTSVAHPIEITIRLCLIAPGDAWPEDELENDDFDAIEASSEMPLLRMVEEEVLLALPIAPMHVACEPPAPSGKNLEPSPFAVLVKLKKQD